MQIIDEALGCPSEVDAESFSLKTSSTQDTTLMLQAASDLKASFSTASVILKNTGLTYVSIYTTIVQLGPLLRFLTV